MRKSTRVPISVSVQLNGLNLPVYNGMAEVTTREEEDGPAGLVGVFYDRQHICDAIEAFVEHFVSSNWSQFTSTDQFSCSYERTTKGSVNETD
jgi:hypothetical protein